MPGDRWLTDEDRAEINKQIAERRNDKEFTERLRRRMEEDRDVLEALAGPDVPVRLCRGGSKRDDDPEGRDPPSPNPSNEVRRHSTSPTSRRRSSERRSALQAGSLSRCT
jgi:chromatin segregation and condensation protein Rec8/ScpA/Scc1 (kleisin family)